MEVAVGQLVACRAVLAQRHGQTAALRGAADLDADRSSDISAPASRAITFEERARMKNITP
jgi:hypothetical protein